MFRKVKCVIYETERFPYHVIDLNSSGIKPSRGVRIYSLPASSVDSLLALQILADELQEKLASIIETETIETTPEPPA
jgi:hypothetical protein